MYSRKDQLQAQAFVSGRLVSAVLLAEPDLPRTPLRRFIIGSLSGVVIGVIVLAGMGIWGLVSPGGTNTWRQEGALIVEKETGARFVFAGGELRPVLNQASARLILGQAFVTVSVSQKSLVGVPHGLAVGIPSAPDSLPLKERLVAPRWTVCSLVENDAQGTPTPTVAVRLSSRSDADLPEQGSFLARTSDGQRFLLWRGKRLRLRSEAVAVALGYSASHWYTVGDAWLNPIPSGADLIPPAIAGRGEPGPEIAGTQTKIGQVINVDGVGQQYFVVHSDGILPTSPLVAAMVLVDPATRQAYADAGVAARPLSLAAIATAPQSAAAPFGEGLPERPPEVADGSASSAPCLYVSGSTTAAALVRLPDVADLARSYTLGTADVPVSPGRPPASRITVEAGFGLLARAAPAPGAGRGTLYLVTDVGVRYPLPFDGVAALLGYEGVTPVEVPASLLSLVPTGVPLDPSEAAKTLPVVPPGSRLSSGMEGGGEHSALTR